MSEIFFLKWQKVCLTIKNHTVSFIYEKSHTPSLPLQGRHKLMTPNVTAIQISAQSTTTC